MSINRDEAARIIGRHLNGRNQDLEVTKCLLMLEISDSLTEIVKELREINRVKYSPQ